MSVPFNHIVTQMTRMLPLGQASGMLLSMLLSVPFCHALDTVERPPLNAGPQLEISINGRLCSLHAEGVSLAEVLRRLGEEAGFRVRVHGALNEGPGPWSFEELPVVRVLRNLTRNHSTVMQYQSRGENDADAQLAELWIYGRGNSPHQTPVQVEIQTFEDVQRRQEIAAIDRLEGLTNQDVIHTLTSTVRTAPDAKVRRHALEALNEIGGVEVLPALEAGMADTSALVRQEVARGLGQVQHQSALLNLGQLVMGDRDPRVRAAALHALSHHPGLAARAFMEAALADQAEQVRVTASQLLAQ